MLRPYPQELPIDDIRKAIAISMSSTSTALLVTRRIKNWRPGAYLRSSAGLFGWLLIRAMAQMAMVLLLTRQLGASGYGQFVAILAVAGFFTPLAGLGLHAVLLREGARNPEQLPALLGNALALWRRASVLFGAIGVTATLWLSPQDASAWTVGLFTLTELASGSLSELVARVEQSQHRAQSFGAILSGLILLRVAALAVYAYSATVTLDGCLWSYAAASSGFSLLLLIWLWRRWQPKTGDNIDKGLLSEGLPFTIGALSLRLQTEFNKPILAQLGFAQVGQFSVAQRVVDLASLPLQALQEAFWSRLYASEKPQRRMWMPGTVMVVLALSGGAMLFLTAPWLNYVMGDGFQEAGNVLRWLAWLPSLQVIRNLMNVKLTALGLANLLTWVYVSATPACLLLTVLLVTQLGTVGAALAAYGNECLLLIILWFSPKIFERRKA